MWNQDGYGDHGGGYMDTTNPPGFSSPQNDRKASRNRAQNILPCTVSQILAADQQNDMFIFDGIELHQVTVVGLVRSVRDTATRLDYEIDDMTGSPIEVKQFIDSDENTPPEEQTLPMRENTYVRVFGNVRSFANKRSMVAFKIQPVVDMNELTAHLLEVIYCHMALTGPGGSAPTAMDSSVEKPQQQPGGTTEGNGDHKLTGINQQVMMIINACHDEQGVSVSEICAKLRGVTQKAVHDIMDYLSNEGLVYSTIDDEHFKSTDS